MTEVFSFFKSDNICNNLIDRALTFTDLVKFVMCTLISRVRMTFCMPKKGYTIPGNQVTHEKLFQIHIYVVVYLPTTLMRTRSKIS